MKGPKFVVITSKSEKVASVQGCCSDVLRCGRIRPVCYKSVVVLSG